MQFIVRPPFQFKCITFLFGLSQKECLFLYLVNFPIPTLRPQDLKDYTHLYLLNSVSNQTKTLKLGRRELYIREEFWMLVIHMKASPIVVSFYDSANNQYLMPRI